MSTNRWILGTVAGVVVAALATAQPVPPAPPPLFADAIEVVGPLDLVEYATALVVTEEEARDAGAATLADALARSLGAFPVRVGDRSDAAFSLRGFDLRRVPVYFDGIPVYVPFDGLVDLDRFLVGGFAGVVVNRGFSSLTYGPNALGGTVNLLRRRPRAPLEGRVAVEGGSGGLAAGTATVGGRGERWYFEATGARRRVDDALQSGDRLQRDNSFSTDTMAAVTVGFTPSRDSEVAVSLIRQDGEKGQPPYCGDDPAARARYWRWPDWDKRSVYVRARAGLGGAWELRARAFHDRFLNTLDSYDDASFSTQLKRSSFRSEYDDFTVGASTEVRRSVDRRRTTFAVHFKRDVHRDRTNQAPWTHYEDGTASLVWEEELFLGRSTRLVAGVSADDQRVAEAEAARRGDAEAFNGAVALFHGIGAASELYVAASRRTRLPTLKDRYSYRMGVSIPNPDLGPETALNLEAGASGRSAGGRWTVSAFWTTLDDAVESVPLGGGIEQYRNVGRARHLGLEGAVEARLADRADVGARVSVLDRERLGGAEMPLTDVPDLRALAWVSLPVRDWLRFGASGEIEGGRLSRTPSGDTRELGGFAVWHASVRATVAPGLELDLRCDNLGDRRYEREEGYPEPGRTLAASLAWAF